MIVHGWAGSFSMTWEDSALVAGLRAAGREVIGIDLLGHGDAPKPDEPEAYVDLTQQLLAALPDEPIDAIAFSLGGSILLRTAIARPQAFHRIVLAGVGESAFRDDPAMRRRVADIVQGVGRPAGRLDEALQRAAALPGNDATALAHVLRHADTRVYPDELASVTCPTLVVIGDLDHAAPGEPLVDALANARLLVLANTSHFQLPGSPEFVEAALRFVSAS
jgi:pimeloyl-ACP methyl ester carboxylesterase